MAKTTKDSKSTGAPAAPRPPKIDYLRRASNHIDVGAWSVHRETWLNYLPNDYTFGNPPSISVANWEPFQRAADESKGMPISAPVYRVNLKGLHELVLRESIFMLHKAWHVLGAAEQHAANGQPTWAQSSGYHAAFFAAKATFGLLGHALIEHANRMCLVRLFPFESRSKTQGGPIHAPDSAEVIYLDKSFTHREIWELYKRVLNTTGVAEEIWPSDTTTFLKLLPTEEFAAERNSLHYQSDAWIFNDLFADQTIDGLGIADTAEQRWTFPSGGFSMCIGERCFYLGRSLLVDMSELAPSLNGETGLFSSTSTQNRHPYYFAGYA
jgi:hypothetical protein